MKRTRRSQGAIFMAQVAWAAVNRRQDPGRILRTVSRPSPRSPNGSSQLLARAADVVGEMKPMQTHRISRPSTRRSDSWHGRMMF